MALNTPPDRFGGVSNPLQPGGIYIAKVVREHGNGTVTVFVKFLGSTIGPIKVVNYTPSTVPVVGEQVLVSFLDNMLNDMVVIGRITPRADDLSIADNLVVDSSTSDALVRFTQRGTGDVLRVEDSTNSDSTPLIVTADGSVGIGLASPAKKLHVSGDAQITGDFTVGTSTLFFDVSEDSLGIGTTTPAAKLHVTGSTSSELVRITQTGAGAALLVEDSSNPDATPFTVDASGKIGIGTTSPAAMLHVTDSSGYGAQIRSTTNLGLLGSNGESDGLRISGGIPDQLTVGGNIYVYGNTHATRAANVTINTNGTEVITVDSSGNVGIGNTSPTTKLDITGSALISGTLNKVTITAPSTSATLTIANGKTLTASNTLTFAGTDSTTMTFPSTSQTIAGLAVSSQVFTTAQTFRATSAIRSEAASTQDAIVIAGRAGGTSSYAVTITPATLSANSTLTLPNTTGTVVTTGDTGTVTSTMILDGTIVNGDISSSAAIADTKLATISTASKVSNSATTATSSNTASAIVARDASGNFTAGTITAALSGTATKASTLAQNGGSGTGMTFNWSGQSGQPTWLWGSNDGTNIYVWDPSNFSVSSAGSSNATTFTGTYVRMSGNGDADPHTEQGLQSGVGGNGAGVAMWASGVAPQLRVGAANNTIYLRNSNDTAYVTIEGYVTNVSSIHLKQNIEDFPKIVKSVGAAVNELEFDTGLDIVRRLRPVTYRWKEDEHFYQLPENPRRALALARLNKLRKENGLGPYKSDELRHDCARDNCAGTAENPCQWTKNWEIGNLGFISQEVGEVVPEAAIIGENDEFTGLDSIAMVAVAVAAIKEMDATITLLKQRIETLENK